MIKDLPGLVETIIIDIRRNIDFAVIGLSGGADSTLVACLCKMALGAGKVEGVHMPYNKLDRDTFNRISTTLANKLGIQHRHVQIDKIADAITNTMICEAGLKMSQLNQGNARSRARMCILYAIAGALGAAFSEMRVRVIGTGNLSEDYIGYDTKGGDALADFFPIGDLYKSEVYQLLDYFKEIGWITEDLIDRHPSAGLWDGQTDEGELGYTYNEMEPVIKICKENEEFLLNNNPYYDKSGTKIGKFVWERHINNKHKHEAPPIIKVRQFCD